MYSNELIVKILDYIDKNLYKKITTSELSRIYFFNKDYIMRLFKKEIGMTIIEYINKKRIYSSLEELKNTTDLMLKVALNHGFLSQEYFSETFTKIIGVPPLTYRNFTKPNTNISYQDINTIRNSITNLNYELTKIEKYKKNVRGLEVKKLSLFK